jgi:hypothetical protein
MPERQQQRPERQHLLMHGVLQRAIREYGTNSSIPRIIRRLFYDRPGLFGPVALQLLRSEPDSPGRRFVTVLLLNNGEVIARLTDPNQFARPDTMFYMRRFMETDPYIDVRLARQLPGRDSSISSAELPSAVRVLDVLDEISPGRRLIPVLGYLTRYPDSLVAGKATMLIARRICNASWIRRHMDSGDPRIRANVVEGLWGLEAPYVRSTNLDAIYDHHNRVVGNALLGLHLMRDPVVERKVQHMTRDDRVAFRSTAAWLLGRIGEPESARQLHGLLKDDSFAVRRSALRALLAMRKSGPEPLKALDSRDAREVQAQIAAPPELLPAPEPSVPLETPAPVAPETSRVDLRLDGSSFRIRR